jgi:antibiotic biosynthesis monooxygenase (ABM) superfamily enzyme
MSEPTSSAGGPVTVVVLRTVKPGREEDFENWLKGTIEALTQHPGYLGANIVRPDAYLNHEYVFIAQWDSYKNALAWEKSPERAQRLVGLDPLIEGETVIRRVSGLEFWFTPPAGAQGEPPAWKMVIVTILALWPTILVLEPILALTEIKLPWPFTPLTLLVVMIPLVTYFIMPLTVRIFSRWLFPVPAKS